MTYASGLPDFPVLSLVKVAADGSMALEAANLPYEELSWTRKLTTCGEFTAQLACDFPAAWPGRYLLTASGMDEVGIVEKVEASEDGDGDACTVSGRFAESLWDRYAISYDGETCRGANWKQAVTAACTAWLLDDAPPLAMGEGTASATGSSYALVGSSGDTAMEAIYSVTEDNGGRPLLSYDRDADPEHLVLSIVEGLDRTRDQSENPLCVISLAMGNATSVDYTGDYSTQCSEVIAYATETEEDEETTTAATVEVPGFDAETMWRQTAYEDVSSLLDKDAEVTVAAVRSAGGLRAYDHLSSLSIDCDVMGDGYRETWDLGDTVEVEMPSLSLVAEEHIETVVETWSTGGRTLTATVGTKELSKVARALIGRR